MRPSLHVRRQGLSAVDPVRACREKCSSARAYPLRPTRVPLPQSWVKYERPRSSELDQREIWMVWVQQIIALVRDHGRGDRKNGRCLAAEPICPYVLGRRWRKRCTPIGRQRSNFNGFNSNGVRKLQLDQNHSCWKTGGVRQNL